MRVLLSSTTLIHDSNDRPLAKFEREFGTIQDEKKHGDELVKAFKNVEIDELSKAMFEHSNDNVAFVGAYDKTKKIKYIFTPLFLGMSITKQTLLCSARRVQIRLKIY